MNCHKNARLTFARRLEMVNDIAEQRLTPTCAAAQVGVSVRTVHKWLARFRAQGMAGLYDASSRPHRSPRSTPDHVINHIISLRRQRQTVARIAYATKTSRATVSRILAKAGLSRLSALKPAEPVQRYEHLRPGDMLHIDTKKLARIKAVGHRATGNPRDHTLGAGYECLFVAIDDHSRMAFTQILPDETRMSAITFLNNAVAYYASLGVSIKRLLTDNGSTFRSKAFANACQKLKISHRFTRCYRPQTNGKAERFIQSALREWAYGFVYHHSTERQNMLNHWMHHYNFHRPHQGINGKVPAYRVNNVLQAHN